MPVRSPFRSPFSLLALAGLVAMALGLHSRATRVAEPGEGAPPECQGLTGDECRALIASGDSQDRGEPSGETGTAETVLWAHDVCVSVGYLCAELDDLGAVELWRWPAETGLIRVWVPTPDGFPPGLARDLQNAAVRGIRAWDRHPIPLSVRTHTTPETPDVTVRWVEALEENRLGRAQVEWSRIGNQVEVRVVGFTLATHRPGVDPAVLSPDEIELVAAHEMGHVLGLRHSDDPRDVMYPENTATRLTSRDFRTLSALYSFPNGAVIRR